MPWPQGNAGGVGDVLVSLSVGYHSIKVGQPLQIRLTAHNEGKEMAVFQTTSKPVLDISIGATRPAEDKALPGLHWADGKELTLDLTRLELKPGESKAIELTWTPDAQYDRSIVHISGYLWFEKGGVLNRSSPGVTVTVGWTGPGPLP
jgi:hypothetical protein